MSDQTNDGREQRLPAPLVSPLLTIREAVTYLRLSQSSLYNRMHEFDVVRLGGRIYLTRASCDKYITSNTQPARKPPRRTRRRPGAPDTVAA